jgi:outer membrane protein TolC
MSLERHPDYQLAVLSVRLIRLEREALEIDLYRPSMGVDVYAGYGPRRDALDANRPEVGADLRFRFPLYTSRDRTAQLEAQRGNLEAARWEAEQQKLTVRSHLLELYQTLRHDRTSLSEHRRLEKQAADTLRLAYVEFARGQKAPADMHEAIDTLFALRRDRIDIEMRRLLTAHEVAELTRVAEASHGETESELNNRGSRDE